MVSSSCHADLSHWSWTNHSKVCLWIKNYRDWMRVHLYALWPLCSVTSMLCDLYALWPLCSVTSMLCDLYALWPLYSVTSMLCDLYALWPLCSVTSMLFDCVNTCLDDEFRASRPGIIVWAAGLSWSSTPSLVSLRLFFFCTLTRARGLLSLHSVNPRVRD